MNLESLRAEKLKLEEAIKENESKQLKFRQESVRNKWVMYGDKFVMPYDFTTEYLCIVFCKCISFHTLKGVWQREDITLNEIETNTKPTNFTFDVPDTLINSFLAMDKVMSQLKEEERNKQLGKYTFSDQNGGTPGVDTTPKVFKSSYTPGLCK